MYKSVHFCILKKGEIALFFAVVDFFVSFLRLINIRYKSPNHMRVGVIDCPDRFEDILDPKYV